MWNMDIEMLIIDTNANVGSHEEKWEEEQKEEGIGVGGSRRGHGKKKMKQ